MSEFIIETKHLYFGFSKKLILDDINLQVKPGSIYGLLGINGAGKTTLIRLLLGLYSGMMDIHQSYIKIFNTRMDDSNRLDALRNIGSLIENASLYDHLSAYENLNIARIVYDMPKERIMEVLEIVGLKDRAKDKTRTFSMGMKQRLGIALAIIHQPKVVILDEPTNGLDPNGIVEIRELIIKLNRELGVTFLMSSHLLHEIEMVATDIGIIHQGKLLLQVPASYFKKQNLQHKEVIFKIPESQLSTSATLLDNIGYQYTIRDGELAIKLQLDEEQAEIASLNRQLSSQRIDVFGIEKKEQNLEYFFKKLTTGENQYVDTL